ncbi:glycoside hydrolase superfamily [Fomitopsis serialis]|uniref:glycoside hydrolase superfamily n=1 Tax=Fomitopsis serialis TaxID=139415 RepID=UPI0020077024|nr:glycoside hydrolase superfamily [Neoantrodia serialis]KAH9925139.1 glycoside hydrolase superfamily [Neoantrodia serialis]
MLFTTATLAGFAALAPSAFALDNGVGRLPSNCVMIVAWNAFVCNIDDTIILETASLMQSLGLQDAGYTQMNLDDCWGEKNRSADGVLQANAERFPSGFINLTSQLHDMGFKAGIYSDSGWRTCQDYPGSYSNELLDAETFQDWGFDYLKYDNCYIPFDDIIREGTLGRFQRMADAIANLSSTSGQPPLIYSLCEWGWSQVWLWGASMANSWRVDNDIAANWDSIAAIINLASFIPQATNFYGRNDMDILEVGNGDLTYEENKSHFTAWALFKSPLLIGTNLSAVSSEIVDVLSNPEILAINQDPVVGTSISPFRWGLNPDWTSNSSFPAQYWSGPSQNGPCSCWSLNTLSEPADMFFNLTESPWIRAGRSYSVRDLWTHSDNGTAIRNFTAEVVPAHGVVALLLQDAGDEPDGIDPLCAVYCQCGTENGSYVYGGCTTEY